MVLPVEPPGRIRLVVLAVVPPLRYQLISSLIQLDLSFVERIELFLPPSLPPWDSLIRDSAESLARVISRFSPGVIVTKNRMETKGFGEAVEFFTRESNRCRMKDSAWWPSLAVEVLCQLGFGLLCVPGGREGGDGRSLYRAADGY